MDRKRSFQYLQQLASREAIEKDIYNHQNKLTFLCFTLQNRELYIHTKDINRVIKFINPTKIAHSVSWFEGLIGIQGEIYNVINISSFLGKDPINNNSRYIIVLAERYSNTAIVVDGILGLQDIGNFDKVESKEYIDVYRSDDKEIDILATERIISSAKLANLSIF